MRESTPVVLVLSVFEAKLFMRKAKCYLRNVNNDPLFLPCYRLWSAQGKQPLRIRKLPEVKLWATKPSFQATRIGHFRDLLILREPNGVQGLIQRSRYQGQDSYIQLYFTVLAGKSCER
jgi:hypothetical protein